MSVSETNTPASTSTSVTTTEEKNAPTLAEVVRKYKTKELIDFLRKEDDLELVQEDYDIIEKERITGRAFLKITEEKLRSYGMPGGPASDLADFAKELGKRKLKSFSSYKTLKDLKGVLSKYGVQDGRITDIPQFTPKPHNIDDKNEYLLHCLKDIRFRLRNMGPVVKLFVVNIFRQSSMHVLI